MAMNAANDLFDQSNSAVLTVTLVDGQRLFMRCLKVLLESDSGGDIQVLGTTDSGANALELVRRCQPHIAIVDVSVGTPRGLPSIRDLKRRYPWIRVLATSTSNDSEIAGAALRAGADGFIPKSSNPQGFVAALRSLAGGYCFMPDQLLSVLVGARRHHGVADELSASERLLWRLIAEGLETSEIASRLFFSERTTRRRIAVLMVRLGVSSRVQAAALAGECGILNTAT